MIPNTDKPASHTLTRLDKFRRTDGPARLAEILRDPTMVEALAILNEKTEPNDSVLTGLVRDYKENAPMVVSLIHASQAGQRRVLRMLNALAHKPQEGSEHLELSNLEPFGHIDHTYLEQR